MGGKKKYIKMFGSVTEPFNCTSNVVEDIAVYMSTLETIGCEWHDAVPWCQPEMMIMRTVTVCTL